jgi:hypothetical protein
MMHRIEPMLASHPHPAGSDRDAAVECVEACLECAAICDSCADACLAESDVQSQVACIRLNIDCADICAVTARLFARPSGRDAAALRAQLDACFAICRACGDECARHAAHMEHCRICAECCRRCAEACERMKAALVA